MPVIGFPKGAGGKLAAYARETGVDAIGLDETVDPAWAARELPADLPVQGNLDPLRCSPAARRLKARCERILSMPSPGGRTSSISATASIKETPIAHVEHLLALVVRAPEAALDR